MAIEILLEGNLKPTSDQEKFTAFLQHFCYHQQVKFEDYGTFAVMEVCPEGMIECSYENDFVSILAQTNVAGPGFHAYAAQLLETLMEESDIEFEVSDPTGYMEHHDFENLKYDYFYKWLTSIANYVKENETLENLCISWPLHYYRPQAKPGYIVTPMGYIAIEDFALYEIEELAERFFLWNEIGKHATFYLNCALNLIWKECFFEYSMMNEYTLKMATTIMDYLEIAHDLDATLPLPTQIYEQLANTLQRESCLTHAIAMQEQNMGYRKQCIHLELGNWVVPISGLCEVYQDQERDCAHIIPGYRNEEEVGNWILQIDMQKKQDFESVFFETNEFIMECKDIENVSVYGKVATINYGEHYELFAQLIGNEEQIIIRFQTVDVTVLSTGMDIVEGVQHVHVNTDASVKH